MNFVALDFETASPKRYSPCSIALTVVNNNQISSEFYSLIKSDVDFFWRNVKVHGITADDVAQAPKFPELWPHIAGLFTQNSLVVAHNASFDCSVLKRTLQFYQLPVPEFLLLDTLKTSRQFFKSFPNQKLNTICDELNIELDHHHNALDDSQACAKILLYQAEKFGSSSLKPFVKPV